MRELRIQNASLKDLILLVEALKSNYSFYISKAMYEDLKAEADYIKNEGEIQFMTVYDYYGIETVINVSRHCDKFLKLERVKVSGNLVFATSPWVEKKDQMFLKKEAE